MELRHLAGFLAVSEELHFGRAASRLCVSQPAVSRLIRQLEAELGVLLLERSTHHVKLTTAGLAFMDEAKAVLAQVEVAARAAREAQEECPPLRIGFTECTEEFLPGALRVLRGQLPPTRLDVRQVDRDDQAQALLEGKLDVAMRRIPIDDAALQTELVFWEPMLVALPARHLLAERERLAMAELAGCRFVLLPRSVYPHAHDRLMALCQGAGFVPEVAQEAPSLTSVAVFVAAGTGISIVPASISGRFNPGDVVYRPLHDPTPTLPVVVTWRRADSSSALERFLHAVRKSSPAAPEQHQVPPSLRPAAMAAETV